MRLTMRNDTTKEAFLIDIDDDDVKDAIHKLADYEDAEEQGLLLRLPCKVGDTVWGIIRYFFRDRKQNPYEIYKCKFDLSMLQELGKTVFLTKEEAESALAEKGGVE